MLCFFKEEKLRIDSPYEKRAKTTTTQLDDDKPKMEALDSPKSVPKKKTNEIAKNEEEKISVQKSIKIEKLEQNEEPINKPEESSKPLDIKQISALVVTELTPVYKSGAISSKDLFKALAKKLTHFILYRNFTNQNWALDEIRLRVNRVGTKRRVQIESDFEHVFD